MSALVGLSQKEINSIERARKDLLKLDELTGSDQHARTCENLLAVLTRVDHGYARQYNPDLPRFWNPKELLVQLEALLPPEEEEDE